MLRVSVVPIAESVTRTNTGSSNATSSQSLGFATPNVLKRMEGLPLICVAHPPVLRFSALPFLDTAIGNWLRVKGWLLGLILLLTLPSMVIYVAMPGGRTVQVLDPGAWVNLQN